MSDKAKMDNPQATPSDPVVLMSTARIQRSISRMAYQIAEDNRDEQPITIVGLKKRGYAVARQLSEQLKSLSNNEVTLVKPDQLNSNEVKNEFVVLVDDVIFSGTTMLEAIQTVFQNISPNTLRIAVLVDRGHRKMPVEATFAGLDLPTKLDEHVRVEIKNKQAHRVLLTNATH
jgi:pyrimidine operon attenuation protein/uracil phosphoribosyltransferase